MEPDQTPPVPTPDEGGAPAPNPPAPAPDGGDAPEPQAPEEGGPAAV